MSMNSKFSSLSGRAGIILALFLLVLSDGCFLDPHTGTGGSQPETAGVPLRRSAFSVGSPTLSPANSGVFRLLLGLSSVFSPQVVTSIYLLCSGA